MPSQGGQGRAGWLLRAAAIAGLLPPPDHSMVSRDLQCKVGPSIDAG